MIIGIRGVTDLYSRASIKHLKAPVLEINSTIPGEAPSHDYIISAPEEYGVWYDDEPVDEGDRGHVAIIVKYHGEVTTAHLGMNTYKSISIFKGDYFVEKGKENV